VNRHHRHLRAPLGSILCVAVATDDNIIRGVAIIGRPISRILADGWTAEVSRVATDGTKNACSALYGAAWRAVRALGYNQIVTYTLPSESGTSLRAAGWVCVGKSKGYSWARKGRPRVDVNPGQVKLRWERLV